MDKNDTHREGGHVLAVLGDERELAKLKCLLQANALTESHDCCLGCRLGLSGDDFVTDTQEQVIGQLSGRHYGDHVLGTLHLVLQGVRAGSNLQRAQPQVGEE